MNLETNLRKDRWDTENIWEDRANSKVFTLFISLCYVSFTMADRGDMAKTACNAALYHVAIPCGRETATRCSIAFSTGR